MSGLVSVALANHHGYVHFENIIHCFERATDPVTGDDVWIHRLVSTGIFNDPNDLCLILGAGYPFQMGGVTPYLDRVGASERVFGDTFHHPPIRGVS